MYKDNLARILGVAAIVIVVAFFVMLNSAVQAPKASLGGTTNYDTLSLNSGLILTGGTITSANTIYRGGIDATSSAASATIAAAELIGNSTLSITPTLASVTITLPATSTLTSWLPNPGDSTSFNVINATGTAATNVTFAAGTGTLLTSASSTKAIGPGAMGLLHAVRKQNTDILFEFIPGI